MKMRKTLLIYFTVILLVIASCGGGNKKTDMNTHEILSTLYDSLALPSPQRFPPLPDGYTLEDSLEMVKTFTILKEKQSSKIQKVAVTPYLSSGKILNLEELKIEEDLKELVFQLKILEAQPLELSVINSERNDSIIEFNEDLLDPQVSDFLKFDLLISFSRIAYSENCNKAAIIGTNSTSGLAGHSAIYFFERKNGKWKIIKSLDLWVS